MASPVPDICPNNPVSVVSDTAWQTVTQTGMEDPSGEEWNIVYRTENVGNHAYDDEIWIKLARDVSNERLYTGGYYRTADFSSGGVYQVWFFIQMELSFLCCFFRFSLDNTYLTSDFSSRGAYKVFFFLFRWYIETCVN